MIFALWVTWSDLSVLTGWLQALAIANDLQSQDMPPMTIATQKLSPLTASGTPKRNTRVMIALCLIVLAVFPGPLGEVTREQITDAFTAVSAFVAATLLLFYGAERIFRFDFGTAMQKARFWQVPIAALLGVSPGCGGAVMVVAAYSSGKVSFGALVATLCATMGDAAFLLIAAKQVGKS